MTEKVLELLHDTVIYQKLGIKAHYEMSVDGIITIRKLIVRPDGSDDMFKEITLPKTIFEQMIAFYEKNK